MNKAIVTHIRVDHIHIFSKRLHLHSSKLLYSIKDREDLEKLEELAPLQNQVKVVRLQDKLGEQNFHGNMKKIFEPGTKSIKDASEELTKTMTENSIKNIQALEILTTNF